MSTILAPSVPMYQQGWAPPVHVRRFGNLCTAPKIPLHQLGWLGAEYGLGAFGPWNLIGPAVVSKSGGTASSAAASAAAGASQGLMFGPIGAGIGALAGAIAGIWASHAARAKGAKTENKAINSAVQAFDAGLKAIFDAANSTDPATAVSGAQAAQLVEQLYAEFWAQMVPLTRGPGAKDSSGGGANCGSGQLNPAGPCAGTPGGHKCDSNCTATCCVGCQDLYPVMLQAVAVFNNPRGGSVEVCGVVGSKYGANARAAYTLTYTPPSAPSSAAGVLSELTGGASGSSSNLLLIAAALAAVFLL